MRLTRGEIIDSALQRAGNNTASMIAAARTRLNRILQDLNMQLDWPFYFTAAQVQVLPNGTVMLPDDFMKPEDTVSLVVQQTAGQNYNAVVNEVDHRTFYTRRTNAVIQATLPRIWTIQYAQDITTSTGVAWPMPNETCFCTFRYKFFTQDFPETNAAGSGADYDADVPAFPYDAFLTDLLFEWAQVFEVDPRRADQLQVNTMQLQNIRGAAFPERSYPSNVPLDPVYFSTPTWGRGGWWNPGW